MGNYDFSGKSPENYEEKCLCVLVLDLSGSMNEVVEDDGIVSTGKTTFQTRPFKIGTKTVV